MNVEGNLAFSCVSSSELLRRFAPVELVEEEEEEGKGERVCALLITARNAIIILHRLHPLFLSLPMSWLGSEL